ncbi:hypothetical protein SAMN05216316_1996 [Nitrosovibrio sp. Nv6]|nr:hypothetical protein SAMN05216316_1996 [Nitrosovibrio sp. Nv6]
MQFKTGRRTLDHQGILDYYIRRSTELISLPDLESPIVLLS